MSKLIIYKLKDNKKITVAELNFYKRKDKDFVKKILNDLKIDYDGIDSIMLLEEKNVR